MRDYRGRFTTMYNRMCEIIAYALPRKVIYYCAIRLIAHGTTGVYAKTNVTQLTAMGALRRWEE